MNNFLIKLFLLIIFLIPQNVFAYEPEIISETESTTTVRFYSESGDGFVRNIIGDDWNLTRESESGDLIDMNSVRCESGINSDGDIAIRRGFIPFDTSLIPDNSEIIEASINLFIQDARSSQNDGYEWVTIIQTFQKNPYGDLIYNDFSECGDSLDGATEGIDISDRKNLQLIENNKYIKFLLNATGTSWIDKVNTLTLNDNTKGTRFGIREGHDYSNIPMVGTYNVKNWLIAHDSSMGKDTSPYLEVTFTGHIGDDELEPVILIPGIMGSWEKKGAWKVDPILHTYDNLWQALINSGYKEGVNLFNYPYEWRDSNADNTLILKEKIGLVKDSCNCEKVDIVAHSMGGLLARSYIQSVEYQDDVDQIIFLATPHLGATEAYLSWEGGDMGKGLLNNTLEAILGHEASKNDYENLYDYLRNRPIKSVQELLPVYDYLKDFKTNTLRVYPDNYPVNTFLDYLADAINQTVFNNIEVANIVADTGQDHTLDYIKVIPPKKKWDKWEYGYPYGYDIPFYCDGLIDGPGDDTVPARSNSNFLGEEEILITSTHRGLVTDAQIAVIEELTGNTPDDFYNNINVSKLFLVQVYSPIDIYLSTPDGERVGKNFNDGSEYDEVENGFYSGYETKTEFISIPNPESGEYSIFIQSNENGLYTLRFLLIENEDVVESKFSGYVESGNLDKLDLELKEDTDEIYIDIDPLGKIKEDLDYLNDSGDIYKKTVFKYLESKIRFWEKYLNKYENENNEFRKKIYYLTLKLSVNFTIYKLDYYHKKNWISDNAKELLTSDCELVLNSL